MDRSKVKKFGKPFDKLVPLRLALASNKPKFLSKKLELPRPPPPLTERIATVNTVKSSNSRDTINNDQRNLTNGSQEDSISNYGTERLSQSSRSPQSPLLIERQKSFTAVQVQVAKENLFKKVKVKAELEILAQLGQQRSISMQPKVQTVVTQTKAVQPCDFNTRVAEFLKSGGQRLHLPQTSLKVRQLKLQESWRNQAPQIKASQNHLIQTTLKMKQNRKLTEDLQESTTFSKKVSKFTTEQLSNIMVLQYKSFIRNEDHAIPEGQVQGRKIQQNYRQSLSKRFLRRKTNKKPSNNQDFLMTQVPVVENEHSPTSPEQDRQTTQLLQKYLRSEKRTTEKESRKSQLVQPNSDDLPGLTRNVRQRVTVLPEIWHFKSVSIETHELPLLNRRSIPEEALLREEANLSSELERLYSATQSLIVQPKYVGIAKRAENTKWQKLLYSKKAKQLSPLQVLSARKNTNEF